MGRNKEKKKANNAKYRASHKGQVDAYNAAYRASHQEERHAYYVANQERVKKQSAARYVANQEEIKARSAAYYLANKGPSKDRVKYRGREFTQDRVIEAFTLDVDTGVLYWRNHPAGTAKEGSVAGGINSRGRWVITLDGKRRIRSRLVFLYFYGWLPSLVDHRDRNKLNDRPVNLRAASGSQNQWNKKYKKKASGLPTRVSVDKRCRTNPFRGYICVEGKDIFLGHFPTADLAFSACTKAVIKYHGDFACLI